MIRSLNVTRFCSNWIELRFLLIVILETWFPTKGIPSNQLPTVFSTANDVSFGDGYVLWNFSWNLAYDNYRFLINVQCAHTFYYIVIEKYNYHTPFLYGWLTFMRSEDECMAWLTCATIFAQYVFINERISYDYLSE